jgi:hypothetical protein
VIRHFARLAAATLFVLLGRAAATDDLSQIYVYSQRETPARSWMTVVCDGRPIADVKRGYFFALNVRPGRYTLSLADGVPVSVDVRPRGEAFVRIDWSHHVRRRPIPVLNTVASERAKRELRFLSYVDSGRIHSTAVPAAPTPPGNPRNPNPAPAPRPHRGIR